MTGHRKRLIDKINEIPLEYLDKVDILELILFLTNSRKNTRDIARNLLQKFHRIGAIAQSDDLMEIDGVGEFSCAFMKCIFKICEYMLMEKVIDAPINMRNLIEYFQFMTKDKAHEVFYLVVLNVHNQVSSIEVVEEGCASHVSINIPKLIRMILNHNASGVILCHNHPGGSVHPSYSDIEITKNIKSILSKLHIKLVDSLIITNTSFFSFDESKLL
jgi:DNA repair protein RadC